MLILQRKAGESVTIGEEIEVSVLSVEAGRVLSLIHISEPTRRP